MSNRHLLRSTLDASINITETGDYPGMIESRYVRRCPEEVLVYLSSQSGCAQRCRMCHLTQSGQTKLEDIDLPGLIAQAGQVFDLYDESGVAADIVHYNFMARGEVFANRHILVAADQLIGELADLAMARDLVPSFKFSTIMPKRMSDLKLVDIFRCSQPDIYYSIYSVDPAFRRRWLPFAMGAGEALRKLADWQQVSHKIPVLHWAFIAGENDREADIEGICRAVAAHRLRVDFNIVRYNPFAEAFGAEPEEAVVQRNARLIADQLPEAKIQVVPRVGFDVAASCGMFINP